MCCLSSMILLRAVRLLSLCSSLHGTMSIVLLSQHEFQIAFSLYSATQWDEETVKKKSQTHAYSWLRSNWVSEWVLRVAEMSIRQTNSFWININVLDCRLAVRAKIEKRFMRTHNRFGTVIISYNCFNGELESRIRLTWKLFWISASFFFRSSFVLFGVETRAKNRCYSIRWYIFWNVPRVMVATAVAAVPQNRRLNTITSRMLNANICEEKCIFGCGIISIGFNGTSEVFFRLWSRTDIVHSLNCQGCFSITLFFSRTRFLLLFSVFSINYVLPYDQNGRVCEYEPLGHSVWLLTREIFRSEQMKQLNGISSQYCASPPLPSFILSHSKL